MLPLHRALLLALACLCLLVMPAAHAKRVALVVGVSDYEHAGRLANPANDAREVARRLRGFGFDVEELWQRSPRKADMDAALVRLRQRAANADAVVVFFAGHGIELGGQNWILPADARLQDERDVRREAIGLDDVLAEIRSTRRGRVNMVFLDACRDNPFRSRFVQSGRNISRGLGRPAESPNDTLIAFATAPGEVARDGTGSAHSPFTQALLSVMDKEPGLEVGLLLRRVRAQVLQATDGRQQPWESGSLVSEFYFANPFGRVTPEYSASRPLLSQGVDSLEEAAWDLCKRAVTRIPCEHYLSKWPNGRYAALAATKVLDTDGGSSTAAAPAPAQPNERLIHRDDFNGRRLADLSPFWTPRGHRVVVGERPGWVSLRADATDVYTRIEANSIPPSDAIRLRLRHRLRPGPSVFLPHIAFSLSNGDQFSVAWTRSDWGPDYCDHRDGWDRVVFRGPGNQCKLSLISSSRLYDVDVVSEISVNARTGRFRYTASGPGQFEFDEQLRVPPGVHIVSFRLVGYGWYTGHAMDIDWIEVFATPSNGP